VNNKERLVSKNYKGFTDNELLHELTGARRGSSALADTDLYLNALDRNGVNILVEELTSRGISTDNTLFG